MYLTKSFPRVPLPLLFTFIVLDIMFQNNFNISFFFLSKFLLFAGVLFYCVRLVNDIKAVETIYPITQQIEEGFRLLG